VTTTYDLPDRILNNQLAFLNANTAEKPDCDAKTYIDFDHGPPKEMFVKCRGNSGDIWNFFK